MVYSYVALNKQGKEKKGSIEAESIGEVKSILRTDGHIPIHISEQSIINKDINLTFGKAVKIKEICVFCRQFANLLSAGVIIVQALLMLSRHTNNKHFSEVIRKVQGSVEKGETLADSLKEHEKVFPAFMIYMIKAGEASGNLEATLIRLAEHYEKEVSMKSQVRKAMIYPIAILIVLVGVIIVMMLFVIPNFSEMFNSLGTELPFVTRLVLNASNGFIKNWYLIIGAIALIVIAIRIYKNTPPGKIMLGNLALKLPLLGNLKIKSSIAGLSRTLSTLITTGISMIEALDITAQTINNVIIKQALLDAKEDVSKGSTLSTPISSVDVFPTMVSDMIAIGEETGDIGGMMNKLADYYEQEVKVSTEALLEIIQPIIIVVMALIVGFFMAAMMSPMMKMYQILDTV